MLGGPPPHFTLQLKCNVKISAVVLKLQHDLAKKVLHATELSWPTICIIHSKKKTRSRWWLFAWLRINFIFFYFETVIHEFQAKCPYVFRKAIKIFDLFFTGRAAARSSKAFRWFLTWGDVFLGKIRWFLTWGDDFLVFLFEHFIFHLGKTIFDLF